MFKSSSLLNILLAGLIMIFSGNVMAQCIQKGRVLEYNGKDKKTPLANVEIVITNAGSTTSDKNGEFTLNFRTLKPGDKVAIRRIEKVGYEIFNQDAVDQWYISTTNTFEIILCRSDKFKQLRDSYYSSATSKYTVKFENEQIVLKKTLNDGRISESEFQQKIKELRDRYEAQLEDIDSYIERFARIDLNALSQLDTEILELINNGEIDKAIDRYDRENLLDKYRSQVKDFYNLEDAQKKLEKAREESVIRRDSIRHSIMRQVDLLDNTGKQENIDNALKLLKEVAISDTSNYEALFDYASYCHKYGKLEEALMYYKKCVGKFNKDDKRNKIIDDFIHNLYQEKQSNSSK